MQNTLAQVLATVIILVKLTIILRMSTDYIWLNDPTEAHTCEEHNTTDSILRRAKDDQLYTQAEFHSYYGPDIGELHWQAALPVPDSPLDVQRKSIQGSTTTEYQTAQPQLAVFTHDRTNSAHQSLATERAAADDHGIAETSASNIITIGIWQVQFPKEWIEYESEIQSIIEQQYQNGEEVARFRQCRSRKKIYGMTTTFHFDRWHNSTKHLDVCGEYGASNISKVSE